DAKRQRLRLELEASHAEFEGDAARLRQVIWNLLKNASKFGPAESEVVLATRDQPGGVLLEVRDRGIGFAPESRERIFEPFEQGSVEVTRRFGGLGLGLAISKAIVEAHGGS